jgi:uncharacterized 2Fe-2S/4Fe-4S cluster protein (DUF4445 family)
VLSDPVNRVVEASKGDMLLDVMREAGIQIRSLSGGKDRCGKCKVVHDSGRIANISMITDKSSSPTKGSPEVTIWPAWSDCSGTASSPYRQRAG